MHLLKPVLLWPAGILAIAFLVVVLLHSAGSVQSEIWIDRPPEEVWKVLTATSSYGSWNPMISRLTGELRVGKVIEFVAGPSADDGMVFRPTVLVLKPGKQLTWKGYVWRPGIFDGEHTFTLEAKDSGTRFVQKERFTGLLAGKLTRGVLAETTRQMGAMNVALKRRVETKR